MNLKSFVRCLGLSALAFLAPTPLLAQTSCGGTEPPAISCPKGSSIMCLPAGGDHWGCGEQNAMGGFDEVAPLAPTADRASVAPSPTATAPVTATADPAPVVEAAAAQSETGTPVQPTAAPAPAPVPLPPAATDGPAGPVLAAPTAEAPQVAPVAAVAEPPSLEDLGEAADFLAENGPSALKPVLAAIASTLAVVASLLGVWEWSKRRREKKTSKCDRCGAKKTETGPCATCHGKKTVEDEIEVTLKCPHCGGTGEDPCHECDGTGKKPLPNDALEGDRRPENRLPCDVCGGTGKKKVGAGQDKDAKDEAKDEPVCCTCRGKKEVTVKQKRQVPCPDCAA